MSCCNNLIWFGKQTHPRCLLDTFLAKNVSICVIFLADVKLAPAKVSLNGSFFSGRKKYEIANKKIIMNEPVHQHYIPQSYLRNFGLQKGKQFVVDTLRRGGKETIKTLATKSICAEKNIYTFDHSQAGDPFALEKFYAKEVDALYPKVYATLFNPSVFTITNDTKREILNTILSLRFRRPAFLKAKMDELDDLFERMRRGPGGEHGQVTYSFGKVNRSFERAKIDEELAERKKMMKEAWLIEHFGEWQEFVNYKMHCGIDVVTVPDSVPIITSDNPVSIFDMNGKLSKNTFHHENMIEVPLNRTSYLIIHPNATSESGYNRIHRSRRDEHFAGGVNIKVEENSDKQLIAYPGDIDRHFESQKRLGEWNKENVLSFGNTIKKTQLGVELMQIHHRTGSLLNREVADKVKEIRATGLMDGEPILENLILELAKAGFLTV